MTKEIKAREYVQNEGEFIEFSRRYSGQYVVWAGLNPRKVRGGKNEDISRRTVVLIDIDYHHGDEGASEDEIKKAKRDAENLVNHLKEHGHPSPWIDMSGNGVHLLLIVDLPAQPDVRDRIIEFYKTLPVEVDHSNADLARMVKVCGTLSLRGPPRLSYMISSGDWEEDKPLEAYLTSTSNEPITAKITNNNAHNDTKPDSAKRIRQYKTKMRPCIRLMLTNENEGAHSKSGDLDHEAHLLIVKDAQYHGLSHAEICALFVNQPDYKKSITADMVRHAIIDNAEKGVIPWYCDNLIKRGWCTEDPALCTAAQRDPLENKKKPKETSDKGSELVNIAHENAVEFFRDQYQTGYTVLGKNVTNVANDTILEKKLDDNITQSSRIIFKTTDVSDVSVETRVVPIDSKQFRWWIAKLYHEKTEKVIGRDYINSAILVLEAETQNRPMRYLYNRFAPDGDGGLWWDMTDRQGRAIHVTRDGWRVEVNPPKIFRRYPHMLPLPEPERGGNLAPFLRYMSLEDPSDKLLGIVATISRLIPEVPRIGTVVTGIQGSGKSTWDRLTQALLDPSSTDLLTLPTKDEDLVQILEHHAVALFDNVNQLTRTQSDTLCRGITGIGNEKRELYTTDDSFIRSFMRVVGLNGISMPVEKSDLFSRVILLPWEPIKERKTDAEMKAQMQSDASKLIGAMLDVLVKAMQLFPDIKTSLNVRMSDFAKWGCAITVAMGLRQTDFEKAYRENIRSQDEESVRASVVAEMIIRYMSVNGVNRIEGSATDLKRMIESFENPPNEWGKPTGDLLSRQAGWPNNATHFGRELTEIASSLAAIGYRVATPRKGRGKSRNYIVEMLKLISNSQGEDLAKGQRSFETTSSDELTDSRLEASLKRGVLQ